MNKETFHYILYHDESADVADKLNSIDCVKDYTFIVTIDANENIDANKRTRVKIQLNQDADLNTLDNTLQKKFVDLWFEH